MLSSPCLLHACFQFLLEDKFDFSPEFWCERDGLEVLDDPLFDERDADRRSIAVSSFLMPPAADEVLVNAAMSIDGVMNNQSAPAVAAEDAALQVVMVIAYLFSDYMRSHDVLHLLPDDGIDDWLVPSGVGGALKSNVTFVVRVCEYLVQLGRVDEPARAGRRRR